MNYIYIYIYTICPRIETYSQGLQLKNSNKISNIEKILFPFTVYICKAVHLKERSFKDKIMFTRYVYMNKFACLSS